MDQDSLYVLKRNSDRPENQRKEIKYADQPTKIGVAVMIIQGDSPEVVLMGKRLVPHGYGTWSFPGGHIEFGETPLQAAVREVEEETGLKLTPEDLCLETCVSSLHESTAIEYQTKIEITRHHYVTVLFSIRYHKSLGQPKNVEPTKCDGWYWMPFTQELAPRPLFEPILNYTLWNAAKE